jgi:hypothetical protein
VKRAAVVAALLVAKSLGDRVVVDFLAQLFGPQVEYFGDPDRLTVLRAGRRGGKSHVVAAKLIDAVMHRPGAIALYLTITRKNARRILLPAIRKILRENKIPHRFNKTDLEFEFVGGGTLILGGIENDEEIEKWRGMAYVMVAVDECQSIPSDRLRELHHSVLRPALADYKGSLTFSGTPGPVPVGYWFELSGPESPRSVRNWTMLDNPHMPDPEQELADIRAENGWTEESATYIREYLGQWVLDLDALVYPFEATRNAVTALPRLTSKGAQIDPSKWRYVISVDVGEVHATAFVVVAAHPAVSEDFIVHAEKMTDMRTDRMATRIRQLRERYPGPVVMDTQGIGKKHADEVRSRYGIPVEAADKADKNSGIRIVRDRLLSGQIKVVEGAAEPLVSEWQIVVWNKTRTDHERDQEDHCCDAAIYAVKRLRNYTAGHLQPQPKPGTPEYAAAEEARLLEALKRRHGRSRREAWDR